MAEPIDMPFGIIMDWGGLKESCVRWSAYWCLLVNMTELSVCGAMRPFVK